MRRHPPLCKTAFHQRDVDPAHQFGDQAAPGRQRPQSGRLLAAAKKLFAGGGPSASLERVARRAGVGVGTLYRHFPTREALFGAVYRHEVDQLVTMAA